MPRLPRIIAPGEPHHITQRGNRRKNTYHDTEDREVHLSLFEKYYTLYSVSVFSYCLMTNHIHLVATPPDKDSLSHAMRECQSAYALYFNRKYNWCGHLWQTRYYSCVLDESHFWAAICYVERNPVRAELVKMAEDYLWSSARAHCGLEGNSFLTSLPEIPDHIGNWSDWLAQNQEEAGLKLLRRVTRTGRPCGSDEFIIGLEANLGRILRLRKGGRKPKNQKA